MNVYVIITSLQPGYIKFDWVASTKLFGGFDTVNVTLTASDVPTTQAQIIAALQPYLDKAVGGTANIVLIG